MRRGYRPAVAALALTGALIVGTPLAWYALADDPPPDQGSGSGLSTSNLVDPTVTDGPTGGVLPSLPIPANPVPGDLPAVPTDLDPQDTSDVGTNGPVTVNLKGKGVGATLTFDGRNVIGTATGLKPGARYISLLYGSMSNARPGEVLTCADVRTAANVQAWSVSGEWAVDDQGNGTLSGTASRDLADGVKTVSIRRAGGLSAVSNNVGPLTGFTPVTSPVVACAAIPQN